MPERALEGLRVVEFTDEIGSYCGRLLGDLGAEVIKVEPPGGGRQRHTPPFFHGEVGPDTSLAFWVHNTSKKSVVLDLEASAGREAALRLAATADVILEDCPVGELESRGLGYAAVAARRPGLVYTSVTGFGQTGPHAGWAYSDIIGQATGGLMTLAGAPSDPPNLIYGNQADVSASLHAAQGTLVALLHAEATGEGQYVDVSAQEAVSMSQETAMETWDLQKRNRVRTGGGGAIPISLPAMGVYKTADGWCTLFVLAPGGADFPEFVDWMDSHGMAADLRREPYATLSRSLNMALVTQVMTDPNSAATTAPQLAHINEAVKDFMASIPSVVAYEEGQGRRLLVGIVSNPKDLAENRQLRERGWYQRIPFDYLGADLEFPGPPYALSETPAVIARPPRLGEHTEQVLASLAAGAKEGN